MLITGFLIAGGALAGGALYTWARIYRKKKGKT